MDSELHSMPDLADLLDPPGFRDPSKPHVTDLIYAIENIGKEEKPFDYEALPGNVKNIMAMGRIWEYLALQDMIMKAAQSLVPVPNLTLEVDGIIGSLDMALYQPDELTRKAQVVVEVKARFSPPREDFPTGNQRYMRQVKSYCYMTGAREVWMPILYLSSRPPNAEYIIHKFDLSDLEVEENWRAILNMKHYVQAKTG
tara:strand:- start:127 stop:723 length:597 start_codon:yes stop_codon:yes gene_type:complete